MPVLLEVPCQVCGSRGGESLLRESFEASTGRLEAELVLCGDCGFLYATPRALPEAADFDRGAASDGAGFARFVERTLPAETIPGNALDARAFDGEWLALLSLRNWSKFGIEPSHTLAERARVHGLTINEGLLEDNHLTPESFDLVTCRGLLENTPDLRSTMQELERLVRPAGHLFVCVPDTFQVATNPRRALTHPRSSSVRLWRSSSLKRTRTGTSRPSAWNFGSA